MKTKVLVTGANGQLGSEFRFLSKFDNQYKWIFTDRGELDLMDLKNFIHLLFYKILNDRININN